MDLAGREGGVQGSRATRLYGNEAPIFKSHFNPGECPNPKCKSKEHYRLKFDLAQGIARFQCAKCNKLFAAIIYNGEVVSRLLDVDPEPKHRGRPKAGGWS